MWKVFCFPIRGIMLGFRRLGIGLSKNTWMSYISRFGEWGSDLGMMGDGDASKALRLRVGLERKRGGSRTARMLTYLSIDFR